MFPSPAPGPAPSHLPNPGVVWVSPEREVAGKGTRESNASTPVVPQRPPEAPLAGHSCLPPKTSMSTKRGGLDPRVRGMSPNPTAVRWPLHSRLRKTEHFVRRRGGGGQQEESSRSAAAASKSDPAGIGGNCITGKIERLI